MHSVSQLVSGIGESPFNYQVEVMTSRCVPFDLIVGGARSEPCLNTQLTSRVRFVDF